LKQYEAMFLFDAGFASNFANVEQEVERVMQRAEAEIILCRKWEERKLAFEIKKRKRGCYVLVYFNAPPNSIVGLERDCQLSDSVLRILVTSAEGISRERMEASAAPAVVSQEGDRHRPVASEKRSDAGTTAAPTATATATATAEPEVKAEAAAEAAAEPEAKPESESAAPATDADA
jgi:small subunit ribosomal protein S6